MKKGIFIVGTHTDIGKTYVSALIAKKLQESGISTGYYKGVLSGAEFENEKLIPGDAKYVIERARLEEDIQESVSYVFQEGVSPHLAARKTETEIVLNKIIEDFNKVKDKFESIVVEGSGGIICPIYLGSEDIFLENIIKSLKLNVVVVADAGLGTINHTLLTLHYLKAKGIKVKGIILNNYDKKSEMHIDNKKVIENYSGLKIIEVVEKNCENLNIKAEELLNYFGDI